MGEVVTWLNSEWIGTVIKVIELGSIIFAGILAFRKWVMKPVVELIDKNEKSVVALEKDYIEKRDEVFTAVESLRTKLAEIDEKSAERHEKLRMQFKDMRREMGTVQDDVADVLGNELELGHQKFMSQGWCSPAEKQHYVDMHKRYSERGHNHLAQHYEEDLLELPDYPPMVGDVNG